MDAMTLFSIGSIPLHERANAALVGLAVLGVPAAVVGHLSRAVLANITVVTSGVFPADGLAAVFTLTHR